MVKKVFFDLETTGVKHWRNGIHQLAGVIEIDGEVKDVFNYKIQPNPKCDIEDEALAIGGITRADLETYRPMKEVYNEFVALLGKHVNKFDKNDKFWLIGFNNASFDNQFLRAWFVQNADTPKDAEYGNYFGSWFWANPIDVYVLASHKMMHVRTEMKDFKLRTVAEKLGFPILEDKLHDALYDIELTMQIYREVANG